MRKPCVIHTLVRKKYKFGSHVCSTTVAPGCVLAMGEWSVTLLSKTYRAALLQFMGKANRRAIFAMWKTRCRDFSKLMDSDITEPINLGKPHECSMLESVEKVLSLTQSPSTLQILALPPDDPTRRGPDIQRACEELNWESHFSL